MRYTVFFTFGDGAKRATSAIVCVDLQRALENAAKCLDDPHHVCPVYEVVIRPGDHSARLDNGAWVWPGADGWARDETGREV